MKEWQQATAPKYASSSLLWKALGRSGKVEADLRERGERVHCGPVALAGWSDAANGDRWTEVRCRLGCAIGLMSSTVKSHCRILRRTSKIAWKVAKSSLGGEVNALCEMVYHMLLREDFFGLFEGMNPGVVGFEACESLFTHVKKKMMIAENYLVRHFLSTQQALEEGDLENASWLPETETPADGLT